MGTADRLPDRTQPGNAGQKAEREVGILKGSEKKYKNSEALFLIPRQKSEDMFLGKAQNSKWASRQPATSSETEQVPRSRP